MPSQGPSNPATAATSNANGGTQDWASPTSAFTENAVFAIATGAAGAATTYRLLLTNFGFTVTGNVDGVVVEIKRRDTSGATTDSEVRLIVSGSLLGDNKAETSTFWPVSAAYATYGGPRSTWGLGLTPAQVNASSFGVGVSAFLAAGMHSADIDHVRVTVHYTTGGSENPPTRQHMSRDIPMVFRTDHWDTG